MAIERFLSGKEVSTWSQVSKKKKPAPHSRSGPPSRGGAGNHRSQDKDPDRDRDRERRDRDRSTQHDPGAANGYRRGSRHHGQHGPHGSGQHKSSSKSKDAPPSSAQKRAPRKEKLSESVPIDPPELLSQTWGEPASTQEANGATGGHNQAPVPDAWGDSSKLVPRTEATDAAWADSPQAGITEAPWNAQEAVTDLASQEHAKPPVESEAIPLSTSAMQENPQKQSIMPTSTVKRTFNYAAAAAAGTSHAKSTPTSDISSSLPTTSSSISTEMNSVGSERPEPAPVSEPSERKMRRGRNGRKARSHTEQDRATNEKNNGQNLAPASGLPEKNVFQARNIDVGTAPSDVSVEPTAPAPRAWGSRPTSATEHSDQKNLEDNAAAVAVAAAAVTGAEQSSGAGDSLSLQFGSFGLSGLEGVNWSATEKVVDSKPANASPDEPVPRHAAPLTTQSSSTPGDASATPSVGFSSTSVPLPATADETIPVLTSSENRRQVSPTLPNSSVAPTGSGMFPVHPMASGGSFPAPNYGNPYIMPPLHAYSPALNSFENTADLGSSRAPNLAVPGSVPLYDPTTLPTMPTMPSANGKYGVIPGLGDMGSFPAVPNGMGKDGQPASSDVDKNTALGTSGLPTGVDPLTPFIVPGYASVQYPHMYTFPNAGYPPPGMAPPGASPFPYQPAGQVSSQGARGGFGFEDGSAAVGMNMRAGGGLGESVYAPGFLNNTMTHAGSQKGPNEAPHKQGRGNSQGGVGIASGIVHGMTYNDYSGNVPGVGNGAGTGTVGSTNWTNRQASSGRADVVNGPSASIPSATGASPNSALYATTAGGAPAGYWAPPQQGGFYP